MNAEDLLRLAKGFNIADASKLSRAELEEKVLEASHKAWKQELETMSDAERTALEEARKHQQAAATNQVASQTKPTPTPSVVEVPVAASEPIQISKSSKMRQMYDKGHTVAQIAKALQSNYSFVYAVIRNYKDNGAPERTKSATKSDIMRQLHGEGHTVSQIAKKLNANYAFVYGVIKRYKEEMEASADSE